MLLSLRAPGTNSNKIAKAFLLNSKTSVLKIIQIEQTNIRISKTAQLLNLTQQVPAAELSTCKRCLCRNLVPWVKEMQKVMLFLFKTVYCGNLIFLFFFFGGGGVFW